MVVMHLAVSSGQAMCQVNTLLRERKGYRQNITPFSPPSSGFLIPFDFPAATIGEQSNGSNVPCLQVRAGTPKKQEVSWRAEWIWVNLKQKARLFIHKGQTFVVVVKEKDCGYLWVGLCRMQNTGFYYKSPTRKKAG